MASWYICWIYHLLMLRSLCGYTPWPYEPWVISTYTSSTAGRISDIQPWFIYYNYNY